MAKAGTFTTGSKPMAGTPDPTPLDLLRGEEGSSSPFRFLKGGQFLPTKLAGAMKTEKTEKRVLQRDVTTRQQLESPKPLTQLVYEVIG